MAGAPSRLELALVHPQAYNFIAAHVPHLTADSDVLEIGGQDMNGTVRGLFSPPARYLCVDIAEGPGVDVVADAATWRPPDPDRRFDVVVCCEVLEHTPDWRAILQTAHDVLAPGGRLIVTCAGPGRPTHSGRAPVAELALGEWYRNISPEELAGALQLAGFNAHSVTIAGQDCQALARRAG
jgi:SAM-dependent methyltransferase